MRIATMVLSSQICYTTVTRSDWRKDVKADWAGIAQQPQQGNQLGRTNLLNVSLPSYYQLILQWYRPLQLNGRVTHTLFTDPWSVHRYYFLWKFTTCSWMCKSWFSCEFCAYVVYITIFNIQALRLYSNTTAICAAICAGAAASAPTLYRCTSIKLRLKLPRLGWVNRREIGHPRTDPNRRLSGRKIYEFLINFEMIFLLKLSRRGPGVVFATPKSWIQA